MQQKRADRWRRLGADFADRLNFAQMAAVPATIASVDVTALAQKFQACDEWPDFGQKPSKDRSWKLVGFTWNDGESVMETLLTGEFETSRTARVEPKGLQVGASGLKSKYELSSLRRGLNAIMMLNSLGAVSATSLGLQLGVPRTTARRILDTLVAEGVAEKVPYESIYRLSPGAARLSSGVSLEAMINHVASPLLYDLTRRIGWGICLATMADDHVVVQIATHRVSPYALSRPPLGRRVPLSKSHAAWLIIAHLEDHEREARLEKLRMDIRATPWNQLLKEPMNQIVSDGYSNPQIEQNRQSFLCVPVFLKEKIVACLSMQYITTAISRKTVRNEFAPILKAVSAEISAGVSAFQAPESRPNDMKLQDQIGYHAA